MNKLILLFGVLICLVAVHARHYVDKNEPDTLEDTETLRPKDHVSRHRRRRWQSSYGYEYPPPSYYYPDRRDDRNNQEVIQNIYRLLEEIAISLKRQPPPPPPQPQPIYIPYPISFQPQVVCKTVTKAPTDNSSIPTPTKRFPAMEDINQNWGFVPVSEEEEDYGDGARPISFEPLVPKTLMKRPSPQVEHGSEQMTFKSEDESIQSTPLLALSQSAPSSSSSSTVPGMCNAGILSCCHTNSSKMQQRQCFAGIGCSSTYDNGRGCSNESIQKALSAFNTAYAPL